MTSVPVPICYSCVHLGEGMTCTAFPDGIPLAIQTSEADHRQPYPGDNGIQYEPDLTLTAPESTAVPGRTEDDLDLY